MGQKKNPLRVSENFKLKCIQDANAMIRSLLFSAKLPKKLWEKQVIMLHF